MATGENSIADSMTKMAGLMNDRLLRESARMSSANWERAQRMAYGEHCHDSDGATDEMILVDSTITINQSVPAASTSPTSQSPRLSDDPASVSTTKTPSPNWVGTLAKLAAGGALIASGGGIAAGIPLLMSGGKDVVETVIEKPAVSTPTTDSRAWTLELGQ